MFDSEFFYVIIIINCFRQLEIFDTIKEVVFSRPCIEIVQELINLLSKVSIYPMITDSLCQVSCK
jgi:hypothetical protein